MFSLSCAFAPFLKIKETEALSLSRFCFLVLALIESISRFEFPKSSRSSSCVRLWMETPREENRISRWDLCYSGSTQLPQMAAKTASGAGVATSRALTKICHTFEFSYVLRVIVLLLRLLSHSRQICLAGKCVKLRARELVFWYYRSNNDNNGPIHSETERETRTSLTTLFRWTVSQLIASDCIEMQLQRGRLNFWFVKGRAII